MKPYHTPDGNYVDEAGTEWPTGKSQPAKPTPQSPTPTPWHLAKSEPTTIVDQKECAIGITDSREHRSDFNIANAAFIVRAVNAYAALQAENAELRELVKAAIKITNGNMPEKWRNEAEQALAKAEGK